MDLALAANLFYYAVIPNAYDIALVVIGDRDYRPVLQLVRRLGKRIAIASIQGCCSPEFADPTDRMQVKDFDLIWLNDLVSRIELKFEKHQRECTSPLHVGDPTVWTTYHPRKREQFFCEDCRKRFVQEKLAEQEAYVAASAENGSVEENNGAFSMLATGLATGCGGHVKKLVRERGFGFVQRDDGQEYFFHLTDLESGLGWGGLEEGRAVTFDVQRDPMGGKAGAAGRVRDATSAVVEQSSLEP